MSEQPTIDGIEVYVRGNVTRNTKGWTSEHTISVKGASIVDYDSREDRITFWLRTENGTAALYDVLDALHQEAARANDREIQRQQREHLAAIQAGN